MYERMSVLCSMLPYADFGGGSYIQMTTGEGRPSSCIHAPICGPPELGTHS